MINRPGGKPYGNAGPKRRRASFSARPRVRRARLAGSTHYMVVTAEGAASAYEIANRIKDEIGIDPRVTVLGHIQRGGSPSARDRETASRMGYEAVQVLLAGKGNRIVATRDGRIVDLDMEEALAMTKAFEMDRYDVLEALTNNDAFGYGKQ